MKETNNLTEYRKNCQTANNSYIKKETQLGQSSLQV